MTSGTGTRMSEDVNFRKFPGRPRMRMARTSTSCGGLILVIKHYLQMKMNDEMFFWNRSFVNFEMIKKLLRYKMFII